jgi:DNA-binding GntR family transcriptional regulator
MSEIHISATLKDQVYQIIKMRIVDQYYKPGQWLQENDVASQLNVSRSPVRAALKSLVHDGLVIELPNKGVFVREFTSQDIRDIFDMRNMMESYAITCSPKHIQGPIIETLNTLSEQLAEAHQKDDLKRYIKFDTLFHDKIIELGGNALLSSTYNQLRSMLQPFRVYSLLEKKRFDDSVKEHQNIIRCICSGNIKKAVAWNTRHLTLAQEAILRHLATKEANK